MNYGLQSNHGAFIDDFKYVDGARYSGNMRYDMAYCTDSEKSCTVVFSMDLDESEIELGQEYQVISATNASTDFG